MNRYHSLAFCGLVLFLAPALATADDKERKEPLTAKLEEAARDVARVCRIRKVTRIVGPKVDAAPGKLAGGLDRIELLLLKER